MIVSISGILINKYPDNIIVDVNGIGYQCYISTNTYNKLPKEKDKLSLHTYFNVSDNNQELYAFYDILEKELFIMLISVSGIGPKTAIGLLSAVSPGEFKERLIAGEVGMLTALPGIGPKTARRIIIELKDKFVKLDKDELPVEQSEISLTGTEAQQALTTLGYKPIIVNRIIKEIDKDDTLSTQEIIKLALKKLK